jgi:hypothetical protein
MKQLLILFAYRLYAPIEVFPLIPFGELRVGGSRYTSQTRGNPAFSSILSSDQRLIIGVNIDDLMEKPYIKPWIHRLSSYYRDASGVVDERKRQNITRFFFNNALAVKLNTIDCALLIKPSHFSPQPANGAQNFTQGRLCSETPLFFSALCFQIHLAEQISTFTGSCTVSCKTMHAALVALGVESFSALCNGGNKSLSEVLDSKNPNMQFWIKDAG